jgi:hypothetical protein
MNNTTTFGYVAMVFVAALLATVATVPFRYAAAQNATSQNVTNSQTSESMTENMIKDRIAHLKAEHPILAGILNKIHSMNATQTLEAIIGVHALERVLDAHALNIVLHRIVAMRNVTG